MSRDEKIIDEVLEVLGTYVVRCQAAEAKVEKLEAKVKKQNRAVRWLAFYMWLEFVCILFLSIGMGILARTMG